MPNIFEYIDYRKYLKDAFDEKKADNPKFSHRVFARLCGFKTSNFVLLISQGKRNLSDEGAGKIAQALKFKKKESKYFKRLVCFDQAKSDKEKKEFYSEIRMDYANSNALKLDRWQYDYYSEWYIPVLHEMVLLKNFRLDPNWIAERFNWKVSVRDIDKALKLLFELRLIGKDKRGKVRQVSPHISSGDDIACLNISNFQRDMILKGVDAMSLLSKEEREIGSVTFAVSEGRLEEAKRMIREFRSNLSSYLSEDEGQDVVCQLNMQLFPITKE